MNWPIEIFEFLMTTFNYEKADRLNWHFNKKNSS